jgi:hypothetical protein
LFGIEKLLVKIRPSQSAKHSLMPPSVGIGGHVGWRVHTRDAIHTAHHEKTKKKKKKKKKKGPKRLTEPSGNFERQRKRRFQFTVADKLELDSAHFILVGRNRHKSDAFAKIESDGFLWVQHIKGLANDRQKGCVAFLRAFRTEKFWVPVVEGFDGRLVDRANKRKMFHFIEGKKQ